MTISWSEIPKQTLLKENGQTGDCWRCCIAALIGVPAASVPHFLEDQMNDQSRSMDPDTQEWLNERGWYIVEADQFRFHRWMSSKYGVPAVIACGPSPRSQKMGDHHALIMIGNKVVYDPHPSEAGLTYISERWLVFRIRDESLPGI